MFQTAGILTSLVGNCQYLPGFPDHILEELVEPETILKYLIRAFLIFLGLQIPLHAFVIRHNFSDVPEITLIIRILRTNTLFSCRRSQDSSKTSESSQINFKPCSHTGAVELGGQGGHLPTQFLENKIENP